MTITLSMPNTIKLGTNSLDDLGEVARQLHINHLFIIGGSLLTKGSLLQQIQNKLVKQGLDSTVYIHDKGEPTMKHVKDALQFRKKRQADGIVAIGGGSVIDLAKAVAVFSVHKMETINHIARVKNLKRLPLIAIPTTAGTGSEVTKVMVITDHQSNIKKNPAHEKFVPDVAILDPLLTVSLPKQMTAYSGIDALAHALEAYVSTQANRMSDIFALEAIRLIREALPQAFKNGMDVSPRERMLLASCYAGIAFSNSSTNLAHATARPLGGQFHNPMA